MSLPSSSPLLPGFSFRGGVLPNPATPALGSGCTVGTEGTALLRLAWGGGPGTVGLEIWNTHPHLTFCGPWFPQPGRWVAVPPLRAGSAQWSKKGWRWPTESPSRAPSLGGQLEEAHCPEADTMAQYHGMTSGSELGRDNAKEELPGKPGSAAREVLQPRPRKFCGSSGSPSQDEWSVHLCSSHSSIHA